jgi:cell wall-associated NlpC family hydrolase
MPSPFRRTCGNREDGGAVRLFWVICLFLLAWGGAAGGAVIRDLGDLSQDPLSHVDRNSADEPLLPPLEQERLNTESDLLYFAPWHRTTPRHTPEQASWGFREYTRNPGYGKGGRPHSPDWIRKIAANAHLGDYPQGIFPAVTVTRTDFRALPTRESHSLYPKGPEKQYPFDNLQRSSEPAGMPVLVTLVSRDRKWFLAEASHILGWVPAANIAAVDPAFMKIWENGRYVAILRDKTPVRDGQTILFRAPLGAVFSKISEDGDRMWIWTAARDAHGKASLRKASIPKTGAVDKPLPLTPRNMARLARELAGEPYGWGGMGGNRDCSALVRDLFVPFGLWLPRNSGDQADAGKFINFRNLVPAEKEALLLRQGVPWRTLLWMPGHVMLYIGVRDGKPLIFHNFWSIRTRDAAGKKGKLIVGRASVTTLHPGRELPDLDPGADLLRGLGGMVLLGETPDTGTESGRGIKP